MLINKACKTSIVRPTKDYINRVAHYIPYRTKTLENLKHQLFPTAKHSLPTTTSAYSSDPSNLKSEKNIQAQIDSIQSHLLLATGEGNRGLINPFSRKQASPKQQHDLLNFRSIGQQEFLLRIATTVLKQPSVQAPNRKRHLQTFSDKQVNKRRVSQLEKDKKLILTAMKKKMQYSRRNGKPIENPGEQLIEIPLSIADNDGNPIKGQKSYVTKALEARYKSAIPLAFSSELAWTPQCCLLEGMFMINTKPLGAHKTLADYANFLMKRFIITRFNRESSEVHIIFDNPGRLQNTPKYFEQTRRDATAKVKANHFCDELTGNTKIPNGKWQETIINCRQCKRNMVKFLTWYFLNNAQPHLQHHQTLYVAGGFEGHLCDTAWFVKGGNKPQPDPLYHCNAEETDTRLWLHAKQTRYNKLLITSPDTDVYHIGLPLKCVRNKNIIVQINTASSRELKFVNLTALNTAIQNDPDLATINPAILSKVLQTLYVCTGCDYISFFSQLGKATFLRYFFQYASFITGGEQPGTLADTQLNEQRFELGFLAFMRLIGTVYFKKHATGFDTPSPSAHFLQFQTPTTSIKQQHMLWLDDIRQNIWYRIKFENEMLPSTEALFLHWQRSCWVIHMWEQADRNTMTLEPITHHGWNITDEKLTVVWDTPQNIQAVRDRVKLLLRGCKCVTGCTTGRCGCKKMNQHCSEGCECKNCSNITTVENETDIADIALEEEYRTSENIDSDTDEIMDWVFGNEPPQD